MHTWKISGADTHSVCSACLGLQHTRESLTSPDTCEPCARLSIKTRRRRLACQASLSEVDPVIPTGASWGDQLDTRGTATLLRRARYRLNVRSGRNHWSFIPWPARTPRWGRCYSARVAKGSTVCFFPVRADHTYSSQSAGEGSCLNSYSSPLAGKILASENNSCCALSRGLCLYGGSHGEIFHPHPERMALGPWEAESDHSWTSTECHQIHSERQGPFFTHCIWWQMACVWGLVHKSRCGGFSEPYIGHFDIPTGTFGQGAGVLHGQSVLSCYFSMSHRLWGQNSRTACLLCQFMKGAWWMRPVSRSLTPPWDLTLVLEALSCAPFEPLQQVELKMLSFKTALLLALTSAKRVSDIHALSVNPFFLGGI